MLQRVIAHPEVLAAASAVDDVLGPGCHSRPRDTRRPVPATGTRSLADDSRRHSRSVGRPGQRLDLFAVACSVRAARRCASMDRRDRQETARRRAPRCRHCLPPVGAKRDSGPSGHSRPVGCVAHLTPATPRRSGDASTPTVRVSRAGPLHAALTCRQHCRQSSHLHWRGIPERDALFADGRALPETRRVSLTASHVLARPPSRCRVSRSVRRRGERSVDCGAPSAHPSCPAGAPGCRCGCGCR